MYFHINHNIPPARDSVVSISPLFFKTELEWLLSEKGAVKTSLEDDPRKERKVRDVLTIGVKQRHRDAEDSDDDSD